MAFCWCENVVDYRGEVISVDWERWGGLGEVDPSRCGVGRGFWGEEGIRNDSRAVVHSVVVWEFG